MSAPDPLALPRLPRDEQGPVFAEPWQAQVFALVLQLHARGAFTWPAWADALARELARDPDDDGSRYYDHWLAALEGLVTRDALLDREALAARKAAWAAAYGATPHGRPVELAPGCAG